jgi:uncharacterized protein (TIGR03067 family)
MQRLLAVLALGLCVALVNAQDDKKDDVKKELENLQGTWKTQLVEESSGNRAGVAEFGDSSLVVKDDKYVFTMGRDKEEGTLKVDPTKKPKTMDVVITAGESKGKTQLGVYELDGDTLKVTVNDPGDANRPKEMGKGAATFTFKKEKK